MKGTKCKLKILVGILIALLIIIGFIILYQSTNEDVKTQPPVNSSTEIVDFKPLQKMEKPKTTQIVTDKFTQKLDTKGNVVVVKVDGKMYIARKGTVLTDGMIITANKESYEIRRLNNERASVSSN